MTKKGGSGCPPYFVTLFSPLSPLFLICHPEAKPKGLLRGILPLRFAQGQNDKIKEGQNDEKRESDAVLSQSPELMRRVCEGMTK